MKIRRLRKYIKPRTGELVTFETKQYYVTDEGLVYDGNRHRYVAQYEIQGYMAIGLVDDDGSKQTSIGVHRLVASVYIRLLNKGENVHHKDHNKKNNNLSNLEIIDAKEHSMMHWKDGTMDGVAAKVSERMTKAWQDGTMDGHGEKIRKAWRSGRMEGVKDNLRKIGIEANPPKQVAQLDMDGRLVKVWPSTMECGRNCFGQSAVAACCRNCFNRPGNNIYKNFKWMYMSDYQRAQHDKAPLTAPVQLELNFIDD